MKDTFTIKKVLKLRKEIKVLFEDMNKEKLTVSFADKYGQYEIFKKEMKTKQGYSREWIEMYDINKFQ